MLRCIHCGSKDLTYRFIIITHVSAESDGSKFVNPTSNGRKCYYLERLECKDCGNEELFTSEENSFGLLLGCLDHGEIPLQISNQAAYTFQDLYGDDE